MLLHDCQICIYTAVYQKWHRWRSVRAKTIEEKARFYSYNRRLTRCNDCNENAQKPGIKMSLHNCLYLCYTDPEGR